MKKLDKHLTLAICGSTMVVLFALLMIDMLAQIIDQAGDVGNGDYSVLLVFAYVSGQIPLKLILFFPMALLIGALMGLGKLAASNELTVMQISGISRLRIAVLGLFVAITLGIGVVAVAEFVGVPLNTYVTEMRADALGQLRQDRNYRNNGIWAQNDNHFINIKGVLADGRFAGVHIYTLNDSQQFQRIIDAESARFLPGDWTLFNSVEKTIGEQRITVTRHDSLQWKNTLNNDIIGLLLTDPEDLSIRDLYKYIQYQRANGIQSTNYALTFWQRVFIPLSTGVMFLLALPFVFGSQRNNSQGRKLFIGIMLGIAYYVSYSGIANIILLTGTPVILGAIIPIILFGSISLVLLWWRG